MSSARLQVLNNAHASYLRVEHIFNLWALISCRTGETLLLEGPDIPPGPRFGVGSGPILLDDVNCTGKEPSLLLCSRREWLCHDCSHQEDVHIACNPEINGESLPASKIAPCRSV